MTIDLANARKWQARMAELEVAVKNVSAIAARLEAMLDRAEDVTEKLTAFQVARDSVPVMAQVQPRRGRPPGSKNKPREGDAA